MCLRTVVVQNPNVMNSEHLRSIKRRGVSRIVEQMSLDSAPWRMLSVLQFVLTEVYSVSPKCREIYCLKFLLY